MLEGRRYRLCLTPGQEGQAHRTAGCCRALWNAALEQRRAAYAMGLAKPWSTAQCAELPDLKRAEGLEWLADAPAQCLQQTLRDLDRAYVNFFDGLVAYARGERAEPPGPPAWKRRGAARESFRFPQGRDIEVKRLNRRWGAVRLPRLGWCRLRWTRALDGEVRYATVSRDAHGWHVAFCVETARVPAAPPFGAAVGLDRGVAVAVADSGGGLHHCPPLPPRQAERLRRLRRRAGRQETARRRRTTGERQRSRRHQRTLDAKASLEAREARIRTDFTHKLTCDLAKSHGLVAIEDLRVTAMTRSAKGTVAQPGQNVSQKAGLNRGILASGWGELARQLDYKTVWYGSQVVRVPAHHSSQGCAECGYVTAANRPSRDVFRCVACGHRDHADTNAARVVLARARRGHEDRPQGLRSQRAEPSRCSKPGPGSANHPTARAA